MRIDAVQAAVSTQNDTVRNNAAQQSGRSSRSAEVARERARSQRVAKVQAQQAPAEHSINVRVDQNKKVVYEVVNDKSGKVVREIPPEEAQRVARNIEQYLREVAQKADSNHKVDIDL